MTVACPDCRSVFRVDPAKVPATGVRARCSICGGIIAIAGGTLPVMVTPASGGIVNPVFATPAASAPIVPRPVPPTAPAVLTEPPSMRSGYANAGLMTPPPPAGIGSGVARAVTPAPSVPRNPTPAHVAQTPAMAGASASLAPSFSESQVQRGSTSTATPARRPINPFLNADPGQRARRLARALVSDLVAYHPQKRDEGLRAGTLQQLFREEIKKSYEEYVEQVGRDLAESSPHFQEALNEILGGGRKLF